MKKIIISLCLLFVICIHGTDKIDQRTGIEINIQTKLHIVSDGSDKKQANKYVNLDKHNKKKSEKNHKKNAQQRFHRISKKVRTFVIYSLLIPVIKINRA